MKNLTSIISLLFFVLNIYGQQKLILDVPLIQQERSNWCWLASAAMIDAFHNDPQEGPAYSQCAILNQYLQLIQEYYANPQNGAIGPNYFPPSVPCPPSNPWQDSDPGNIEIYYDAAPAYFIGVTYNNVLLNMKYYNVMEKTIDFENIKTDINQCMPLIMGITTNAGGGHIVVVKGYERSQDGNILHINDPNKTQSTTFNMVNFEAANSAGAEAIHYFISGIRRRDKPYCNECLTYLQSPISERIPEAVRRITTETVTIEKTISFDELVNNLRSSKHIDIPIYYLNIDFSLIKGRELFIQKSVDEFYYNEKRYNILTKEKIKGEEKIVFVKTANYSKIDTVYPDGRLKPYVIINLEEGGTSLEIVRTSGPYYQEFFKYSKNGQNYIVPAAKNVPFNVKGKNLDPRIPIKPNLFNEIIQQVLATQVSKKTLNRTVAKAYKISKSEFVKILK